MIKQNVLTTQDKIGSKAGAALTFALSKSSVLFAPLLLSNAVSVEQYGLFEYALGIGSILGILLAAGIPGAVPYFLISKNRPDFRAAFHAHVVLLGLVAIGATGFLFTFAQLSPATFGISIGLLMASQAIHSTICKSTSRPGLASVLESGFYLALLLAVVFSSLLNIPLNSGLLLGWVNLYGALLLALSLRSLHAQREYQDLFSNYRKAVRFGLPLILSSLLIVTLTNGGRILVSALLSGEAAGIYSFIFRVSATVLIIHQLINTLFFRRLYESKVNSLDNYFCLISLLIIASSSMQFLLAPLIPPSVLQLSSELREHRAIHLILTFHMIFWVSTALLENVIYRSELGKRFSIALCIIVPLLALSAYLLNLSHALNLEILCMLYISFIFLALMSQFALLFKAGVSLKKFFTLSVLTLGVLILLLSTQPSLPL